MISHLKTRLLACAFTTLAVLHPTAGHCAATPATRAVPVAAAQLDHISITSTGTGDPVFLIPGLSTPRSVWDGVAAGLARNHRVYLVQVNGFGGDDPRANLTGGLLEGVVADLHAYIAAHKLGGVPIVGHSLGGLAGLMLAKKHPDDVRKLMMVDSVPFVAQMFLPSATVAMVEHQAKAMRDRMAKAYGKPADESFAQATADRLALKPQSRRQVASFVKAADPRVSAEAFYEGMTTDLRGDLASIATPITLLYPWSAETPKNAVEPLYRQAFAKAPHVNYVEVADSAHFIMLDQPEVFAASLRKFLGGEL